MEKVFEKYYWLKTFLLSFLISVVVLTAFFAYSGSFDNGASEVIMITVVAAIVFGFIATYFKHFYSKIDYSAEKEREKQLAEEAKAKEKKEIEDEAMNYEKIDIKKSSRGRVVQITALLMFVTIALAFNKTIPMEQAIFGAVVYIPLAAFVYKGNRVAMYIMMAIWSLEKIMQIAQSGGKGYILILVWWFILAAPLFKSIQVENERRRVA
jgi:hypothetical protein